MHSSTELHLTPMLRLMLTALGLHDRATLLHSLRVAAIVAAVAPRFGLAGEQRITAITGALLHDLGKLRVPSAILLKPGPLDAGEWATTTAHPHQGAAMLKQIGVSAAVANVVRYHHERWDGSGYPLGLSGTLIPPAARLVSVADAFDVMTAGRPYAPARSKAAAIAELRAGAGSHWAPGAVEAVTAWALHARAPIAPLPIDHLPSAGAALRMSAAS